jgi:hypothetical protein
MPIMHSESPLFLKGDAFTFTAGWTNGTCFKKSHNPDLPGEPPFTYVRDRGFLSGVVRSLKR